jgi:hypothetical protein
MDMIGRIRRLHSRKNKSEREIARITGLSEPVPVEWTPRSAMCAIFRRPARSLATNRSWPPQG